MNFFKNLFYFYLSINLGLKGSYATEGLFFQIAIQIKIKSYNYSFSIAPHSVFLSHIFKYIFFLIFSCFFFNLFILFSVVFYLVCFPIIYYHHPSFKKKSFLLIIVFRSLLHIPEHLPQYDECMY